MNIIFLGSSSFSIPVLEALVNSKHRVVHVVTTPDRKKGRGQKMAPTEVKYLALEKGLACSSPEKLRDESLVETLKTSAPDFLVVASYGKMVPNAMIALPKLAPLNVHPSLLPKYRGASPIQSAILSGDRKTGVSIAEVTSELDAGDLFGQVTTEIGENENTEALSARLAVLGGKLLLEIIEQFGRGNVRRTAQDSALATMTHKIHKDTGKIDWNKPAGEIHNLVRASFPWPAAFTFFHGKRLKILSTFLGDTSAAATKPGTVLDLSKEGAIIVATRSGPLRLRQVQLEGRKEINAAEFARGERIRRGDCFETL